MADQTRLLELALKGLESERNRIDEEISDIRQRLGGGGGAVLRVAAISPARPRGRRGRLSAAGRRKISEMMKARWAARRAGQGTAAKSSSVAAKKSKKNRLSAAGRRAISEAMKRRWAARRKASK